MGRSVDAPAPDIRIQRDKMTVKDIYPTFQKKSEREVRQETAGRLYQIFKKYV